MREEKEYNMNKRTKLILFLILILAFLMRVYNFKSFYIFSHDSDLASWIIKDIVVNNHFRLIGQETSSQGVFIGALFYYLQIPFYLLGQMNPLFSVFLTIILGVFTTYSIFFVFNRIANSKVGLIGAFIYALSALIVFTDREVVPTMPVVLWTVWYLYSLLLVYKDKQFHGFILSAILIGLVWHINLALILLIPLLLIALVYSKQEINLKTLVITMFVFFIVNSPLIFFEYRHNFSQTKSIVLSLTTEKEAKVVFSSKYAKFDRVMQLVNKNAIGLLSKYNFVNPKLVLIAYLVLFIYLHKINKINNFWSLIFVLWQGLFLIFFTLNPLNPSEYYLNGMNIVWIFILSLSLSELYKNTTGRKIFYILLFLFVISNLNYIFKYNTDKKGYVEKMNIINKIEEDSSNHDYPCTSISYITKPGYNLGYRYLFWLKNMHVNNPISNSPVYTIVYPPTLVDKVDEQYGSLGLIYPDYQRYNKKGVIDSCKGENSNLTDPMFGYVE